MEALRFTVERSDSPVGRPLREAFLAELGARYPGFDPARAPSAEPDELAAPHGAFLVGHAKDEPVACGALKRLDARTAEVKGLYVAPALRGRGAGRALMAALERHAAGLGYRELRLDVGAHQPEALALYHALGWREIADYNANPYAAYWFAKALPPRACGEETGGDGGSTLPSSGAG